MIYAEDGLEVCTKSAHLFHVHVTGTADRCMVACSVLHLAYCEGILFLLSHGHISSPIQCSGTRDDHEEHSKIAAQAFDRHSQVFQSTLLWRRCKKAAPTADF